MNIDVGMAEIRSFVCQKLKANQWHMLPAIDKGCYYNTKEYQKERMRVRKMYPHYVLCETETGLRYCFLYQDLYQILFPSESKERMVLVNDRALRLDGII